MSQNEKTYKGNCFCGAVEIVVSGDAEVAAYCHCESCRSWSASPVNAGTLWKPDAVQVTRGAEHIGEFRKTERSHRQWCKLCGGHVMNRHPDSVIDVEHEAFKGALEAFAGLTGEDVHSWKGYLAAHRKRRAELGEPQAGAPVPV